MQSDAAAAAIATSRITRLSNPKNPIILPSTNLHYVDLTGAVLIRADLTGANPTGAYGYEAGEPGSLIRRVLVIGKYLMGTGAMNVDTVNGLSAEDNPDPHGPWFGPRSSVPR